MLKDLSLSAIIAGFIAVIVAFTSTAALIYQAAYTLGASQEEIGSWIGALGIGMGVCSFGLSWYYRMPILIAWSTPGAAMLIASTSKLPLSDAIGAFVISGVLMAICGFSKVFEKAIGRIPISLASGMLAGVLLRFGLDVFVGMQSQFYLIFSMFIVYLLGRRWWPRYTIVVALAVGIVFSMLNGLIHWGTVEVSMVQLIWTTPSFSLTAMVSIALPLFVVTMASQNLPGVSVIRASGFRVPISPVLGWTGVANTILAPFGAYALNLAAITAALCMGKEAHELPEKRYISTMAAGTFYFLMGLFGATLGAVLAAFPHELIIAIAGLALLGTIGGGLTAAMSNEHQRDGALITFLVTASGMTLWGVGSAFWGILAGALAHMLMRLGKN